MELNTIGKIAFFIEIFYGIKLNDKDIRKAIPVQEPTKTKSFQKGYCIGKILIENGFTKEHYLEFYNNLKPKLKNKIDATEFSKNVK